MSVIQFNGNLGVEQLDFLQKAGDSRAQHINDETQEVINQYPGLIDGGAADVVYLRTRSRHTPELEARLVASHLAGKVININDWPYHEDNNTDPFTGAPLND
jgi:hypothetical protein